MPATPRSALMGEVITGSVNNAKGTFAHNLNHKPQNLMITIIGATGVATANIYYDYDSSTATNVVLVGSNPTYLVFRATPLL